MKKYEEQEEIFEERNSYSKTDHDAKRLVHERMKEDLMGNGQLKPGIQRPDWDTKQFILGYSIHQRPGDTACLIEHLGSRKRGSEFYPEQVIADARIRQ